ncbi:hypothetical protein M1563_05030 [Patescibacteria group bacterium]|nr:hypothetical protein [Patescibacteria group bacterium]MCL5409437.1 hypothetical protein [Patescibacteria group bacterium]
MVELKTSPEYRIWQLAMQLKERTKPGARNTQAAKLIFTRATNLFDIGLRVVEGFEQAGDDEPIAPEYRQDMDYHNLLQIAVHTMDRTGVRQAVFDPKLRDALLSLRDSSAQLAAGIRITEGDKESLYRFSKALESQSGLAIHNLRQILTSRSSRKLRVRV